jgi:hypothetical protein
MIATNSGNGEEEQECNRFEYTIFLSCNQHRHVYIGWEKDGIPMAYRWYFAVEFSGPPVRRRLHNCSHAGFWDSTSYLPSILDYSS